jgi:hypothetical protein
VINAWLLITITESDWSDSFLMLIKRLTQTFYPTALFEFQIEKVRRCWFHLSRVCALLRSNTECNIMLKARQLQIKSPTILRSTDLSFRRKNRIICKYNICAHNINIETWSFYNSNRNKRFCCKCNTNSIEDE